MIELCTDIPIRAYHSLKQTHREECARKKWFIYCALLIVLTCSVFAEGTGTQPKIKSLGLEAPKQILFVGNSYFYYNNSLHNKVLALAKEADPQNANQYQYKSVTISGAYLAHHDVASYMKKGAFGYKKPFDVVILQGNSSEQMTKEKREAFLKTVKEYDALIRATGAKTVLFMTWAYTPKNPEYNPNMTEMNREGYTEAGNAINALVIPVGIAFEEAYKRRPGIKLQKEYDGSHPDVYGSYLAACVVYTSLYGKSPVGLTYDDYGTVDKETAHFLQTVAWDTVQKYYGR